MTMTPQASTTMVSTREVPWMKLGKLTESPMTAATAAELGGLNFTVEKRQIYVQGPSGSGKVHFPDRVAIVRTDTETPLGIMSKNYPILQYGEAFDFMDTVNPTFVAAGVLKGGKQGFMVVKTNETINVLGGDDPHELFTVLRTSQDGTRAVEVSVMPLRHRCMNQLTLNSFAVNAPHRWSVPHTSSMPKKLADAHDSLQKLGAYAAQFEQNAQKLADMKITDARAEKILTRVLPDRPRRDDQVTAILSAWHGSDKVGFDFTGWGLVNAVSEYFEWGRTGGSPESRFIGALQGSTTNMLNRTAGHLLSRV